MENEIWKDIPGYDGYYQVSNYGRVKSMYFNAKKTLGYNIKINPKIIKNGVDRHAYEETGIDKTGISMCSRGLLKTSGGYIWKKGGKNER